MKSRKRILVIDDDPMFRNLIVSLLRKDYLISVATDGESGFEKALLHRPDLVIIDYQMPGWNGIKTLKAFRTDVRFQHVKTIMLTSNANKETVLSAIHAGTDSYIIKTTFDKEEFLAKVHNLLEPTVAQPVSTTKSYLTPKPAPVIETPVAATPVVEKQPVVVQPVEVEEESAVEVVMTPEERELAKEMEAFQASLHAEAEKQASTMPDELVQESVEELIEIASPEQGFQSENELLEDAIDEWD